MSDARQAEALIRHRSMVPFLDRLESATPDGGDQEIWGAIIEQAARFAEGVIDPLDATPDRSALGSRRGGSSARRVTATPGSGSPPTAG